MLLPIPSNRPLLRSFWLILSLATGLLAGFLAWLVAHAGPVAAVTIAGAILLAVAVPGLLFPYSVAWPYRGWNWAVRKFANVATRYVTAVCFWTVGLAFARASESERFEASPSGPSAWKPRSTQPADAYVSEYTERLGQEPGGRFGTVRAWMNAAGPPFAWAFLPFFVLIRWLDTGATERDTGSANIYTLY